ncbi:hypothetical protein [Streptomyces sp. NBC_01012]|uniref:hypothetical protein n=1 Tax=Streptomyces sp. NBC_01012 TaxID=2903717 RepID=UPI003867B81C|nr:hypothetical protein OG623_19970 [Streptomyces sp. NBC_01012]
MPASEAVAPRRRSLAPRARLPGLVLLVGVLALLGLYVLLPSTGPADRDGSALRLSAPASFRVAPYGGKPRPDREKNLLITYDRGVPRGVGNESTLTMDVTGSSGVLRLKGYSTSCSGTDHKVVCHVGEAYDSWTDGARVLPRAAPTSKPGDVGELHITFRNADGGVSRATTRIAVGGPILALREQDPVRMGSGKRHAAPLDVRNTGELPADGFAVTATVDGAMGPVQRSRSCDYLAHRGTTIVTCRFPGVRIEPGEEAHVANWLVLGGSRTAMGSFFRATVQLLGTGADNGGLDGSSRSTSDPSLSGTPSAGTGPALAPQVRAAPSKDVKYSEEKEVWTTVRIANHPDYVLVSDLSAADSDGRRLRVGLRNDGPGRPGGGSASLVLTLPEGTEVHKEPMEEIDTDTYEPVCRHQGLTYTCPLRTVAPGESYTLDFEVRGAKSVEGGKARATLKIGDTEADHADLDATNNARTFDLFGPVPDEAAPDAGTNVGVVVTGALGGCVVLAGVGVLARRKLRRR